MAAKLQSERGNYLVKINMNIRYLYAFIVVFIIEIIIAVFINDNFIRPYAGDVLVVILIYCFIRSFVKKVKLLPLYILIFAVLVETGQYFNLTELTGLNDYKVARIIIGSTFDIKDIACYSVGCMGLFLYENIKRPEYKKSEQADCD